MEVVQRMQCSGRGTCIEVVKVDIVEEAVVKWWCCGSCYLCEEWKERLILGGHDLGHPPSLVFISRNVGEPGLYWGYSWCGGDCAEALAWSTPKWVCLRCLIWGLHAREASWGFGKEGTQKKVCFRDISQVRISRDGCVWDACCCITFQYISKRVCVRRGRKINGLKSRFIDVSFHMFVTGY